MDPLQITDAWTRSRCLDRRGQASGAGVWVKYALTGALANVEGLILNETLMNNALGAARGGAKAPLRRAALAAQCPLLEQALRHRAALMLLFSAQHLLPSSLVCTHCGHRSCEVQFGATRPLRSVLTAPASSHDDVPRARACLPGCTAAPTARSRVATFRMPRSTPCSSCAAAHKPVLVQPSAVPAGRACWSWPSAVRSCEMGVAVQVGEGASKRGRLRDRALAAGS